MTSLLKHLDYADDICLLPHLVAPSIIWILLHTLWLLLDQMEQELNLEDSSLCIES